MTRYSSLTHPGRVRPNNEDTLIVLPEAGLFGVCDGMGGHASGEVASRLAAKTLEEKLVTPPSVPFNEVLESAILEANTRIFELQRQRREHRGMGTTLSVLWLPPQGKGQAWIGHVGDSRIYRFRADHLVQLTEDHTPVFRLYQAGMLSRETIRQHPQRNLLDRALGTEEQVEADVFPVELEERDVFLICSDGLNGCLDDAEIETIIGSRSRIDEAVRTLIEASNLQGGFDNISVVLVQPSSSGER